MPDERTERTLYLSHYQYAEMMEHMSLVRIRPDGSRDDSQFIAWAMSRFGLRPFCHYNVIIDHS